MALTPTQLTTLKTAINAETDPTFVGFRTALNDAAMAGWFNTDHVSAMVWRPAIPVTELMTGVVWSAFAGFTAVVQNTWAAMTASGTVDATSASVRAGFATVFGGGSATATNLTAIARRKATRFENVFATAEVSSVFGVSVTDVEINKARLS